jgi:hypothetical protein
MFMGENRFPLLITGEDYVAAPHKHIERGLKSPGNQPLTSTMHKAVAIPHD